MGRTAVLGVGNILLSDEGVGVHVLRHLQTHHPDLENTDYVDAGTLGFTLAASIEDADGLIVIDAARLDAPPGTVRCLTDAAMDGFLRGGCSSVHELGLADLLDAARLIGRLPRQRALVGIQPGEVGWGDRLSAEVTAAVLPAANLVLGLLSRWREAAARSA